MKRHADENVRAFMSCSLICFDNTTSKRVIKCQFQRSRLVFWGDLYQICMKVQGVVQYFGVINYLCFFSIFQRVNLYFPVIICMRLLRKYVIGSLFCFVFPFTGCISRDFFFPFVHVLFEISNQTTSCPSPLDRNKVHNYLQ